MRLKTKNKRDTYPPHVCAASRCDQPSEVIYAVTGEEVPFCDRHWVAFCVQGDRQP